MSTLDLTKLREIANAAHIATFDPPTVIALIDEAERLRGTVAEVRRIANVFEKLGLEVSVMSLRTIINGG